MDKIRKPPQIVQNSPVFKAIFDNRQRTRCSKSGGVQAGHNRHQPCGIRLRRADGKGSV